MRSLLPGLVETLFQFPNILMIADEYVEIAIEVIDVDLEVDQKE